MKVLGMGNALVDVLALIEGDNILSEMGLPKGSMQLIDSDKLSMLNTSIANVEKFVASGGSASNTITAMAELGIDTGFLGKIGRDAYGKYYKEDLERYGVCPFLTIEDSVSGVATTFISKDGERTFGTFLGAAANLKPEDLKPENFAGYDYFYIEGYLVQNLDLICRAINLAKESGSKVILDLASYNVVEENRDFLLKLIPDNIDIVFANKEEINALLRVDIPEALDIMSKQLDIIVIKNGAEGSWVQKGDARYHIPGNKVNRIDSTGAGDLYAAGFMYGLIYGFSLNLCGAIGNYLAEMVIQVVGAKMSRDKWVEIKKTINGML